MRIVYCLPGLYNAAGMERVLSQKVNWLAEHTDWEITIMTTEVVPEGKARNYFPLHERIEVVEWNIDFNADYRLPIGKKWMQHRRKQKQYEALWTEWVNSHDVDVCVSLCGKEIEWLGKAKAKCRKIAEIHFAMDYRAQWLAQTHQGLLWRLAGKGLTQALVKHVKKMDKLVVLTQADAQAWREQGVRNIAVIANPCSMMPEQIGKHDKKQVLAVGRLERQKGFDWLIEAWGKIAETYPEWTLKICGEGSQRIVLEKQIEELGLRDRVEMNGVAEKLEEEYMQSRLFVLSSRYEGLPLALMEAMSCGLCCIAMDCKQGPKELIGERDERGRLVALGDVEGLARAMAEEIAQEEHAQKMGQQAYAYAHARFDIDATMRQWVELFAKTSVVHTVNRFSQQGGGTSTCVYDLAKGMNEQEEGVSIQLVVTEPKEAGEKVMGAGEQWITAVENDEKMSFGWSQNLGRALRETDAAIYHTNGLWRYCNHVTAVVARRKNKPLVVTPHGMLYPQALQHSYWKKRALGWTLFDRDMDYAACLHATCKEEMEAIRAYGYKGPVAVIGNAVAIPEQIAELDKRKSGEKIQFGFLGRLHPRKHVEYVLQAMARLTKEEQRRSEVVIMGSGEADYEAYLHDEVARLQLENVRFMGFVEGKAKYEALRQLSALIVPSDFENFGMIVPEALLCGTPVFAGLHTPWEELNTYRCGWWREADVEHIKDVMTEVIAMEKAEQEAMGERGRELICTQYNPTYIYQQMQQLYEWLLGKRNKPNFVYET